IFVTGATGYIGSAAVKDMLAAGHHVLGLARSEQSEASLRALGAEPLRGALSDHASLRRAAEQSDAIAHLAFSQDLTKLVESGREEADAIELMGEVFAGSDRAFVTTSGCGFIADGKLLTEDIERPENEGLFRVSEQVTKGLLTKGVKAMIVRIPQVNGPHNSGFVALLIKIAREKGYAAYVGSGENRWPAAHVDDAGAIYRLAIERGQAGGIYHAVAEEALRMRDLVALIAEKLGVPIRSIKPEEADAYFGPFAMFAQMDCPVSSVRTRAELGWNPTGPTTFTDLREGDYFDQA
ncbi:MAG TPA: SDR family oxidoreductase, partial [Terriglobales bacterium]